ncbi:hypothetical protein BSL78_14269 [Apostichopus japonicus]|uniref:Uncharacterized protein n=1 Tax=Stichopus japonicus TaxID=307972 RepID=A0A2G8KLM1_STIJA|nr:hypothetical protein BSL78_14269 [Apostichopus japonicus]
MSEEMDINSRHGSRGQYRQYLRNNHVAVPRNTKKRWLQELRLGNVVTSHDDSDDADEDYTGDSDVDVQGMGDRQVNQRLEPIRPTEDEAEDQQDMYMGGEVDESADDADGAGDNFDVIQEALRPTDDDTEDEQNMEDDDDESAADDVGGDNFAVLQLLLLVIAFVLKHHLTGTCLEDVTASQLHCTRQHNAF